MKIKIKFLLIILILFFSGIILGNNLSEINKIKRVLGKPYSEKVIDAIIFCEVNTYMDACVLNQILYVTKYNQEYSRVKNNKIARRKFINCIIVYTVINIPDWQGIYNCSSKNIVLSVENR